MVVPTFLAYRRVQKDVHLVGSKNRWKGDSGTTLRPRMCISEGSTRTVSLPCRYGREVSVEDPYDGR